MNSPQGVTKDSGLLNSLKKAELADLVRKWEHKENVPSLSGKIQHCPPPQNIKLPEIKRVRSYGNITATIWPLGDD